MSYSFAEFNPPAGYYDPPENNTECDICTNEKCVYEIATKQCTDCDTCFPCKESVNCLRSEHE